MWVLIIGSRMVSHWVGWGVEKSPEGYAAGSPFDRAVFTILISLAVIVLAKRRLPWSEILREHLWITLFFAYAGTSILWSDFPTVSLKRWIKDVGNVLMVLIVLSETNKVEAVKSLFSRCAYALIPLSVVLYKYFPQHGRGYHAYSGELAITGVATSKNNLGVLCLVGCLFLLWNIVSVQRVETPARRQEVLISSMVFCLGLWLLMNINSATALVCFSVGAFIILLARSRVFKGKLEFFGRYLFIGSLLVTPLLLLGTTSAFTMFANATGHGETFQGRVVFWPEIIALGESSIVGVGYGSFWLGERLRTLWDQYWWSPRSAHNGYVETYLELGLIGVFLLIALLGSTFKKIRSEVTLHEYGVLRLTFFILVLLYNITESSFSGPFLLWFTFLLLAIEMPKSFEQPSINISGWTPARLDPNFNT